MTKDNAIWLLVAVAWAYGEGQSCDDMWDAARALIKDFGITRQDAEAFQQDPRDGAIDIRHLPIWS